MEEKVQITADASSSEKRHAVYKDNYVEYMLCLALDIGEGMLRNGGEVSRVEEAVERICRAYGAMHVEVFSIVSVVHASVRMPDGSYSAQMRRIRKSGTDLGKLESFNALSREVCATKMPFEELEHRISSIKARRSYPAWLTILAMIAINAAFTLFFGGTIRDTIIAGFIGAIVSVFELLPKKNITGMAQTVVSSFIISLLAAISVMLGIGDNGSTIIIGSIMTLVPGISFGTALRDLLIGDLATGSLRTLSAVLQALMIAFGYMLAVALTGGAAI